MADFDNKGFVDEGQARAQEQQKALLSIIAQQGAAGAQAYAGGQGQVNAQRDATAQAYQGSMAGSAAASDPSFAAGEGAKMQAIQGLYSQDIAAGQASLGADMQRQSGAASQYMNEVSQAMPVHAADVQRQAQALQAKADHDREMRQMEMEMQRMALEKARIGASGSDNPNADLIRRKMEQDVEAGDKELQAGDPDAELQQAKQTKYAIDQEVETFRPANKEIYDALYHGRDYDHKKWNLTPEWEQHLRELVARDKANKAVLSKYADVEF